MTFENKNLITCEILALKSHNKTNGMVVHAMLRYDISWLKYCSHFKLGTSYLIVTSTRCL